MAFTSRPCWRDANPRWRFFVLFRVSKDPALCQNLPFFKTMPIVWPHILAYFVVEEMAGGQYQKQETI